MPGERMRTAAAAVALACAVALGVLGAGLLHPAVALGAPPEARPALVLSGDPPGTVHALEPGVPALWNIGVTVHRMPVSTLVGYVASTGGFAASGTVVTSDVELLGCASAWAGATCASGGRVILPPTSTDTLPSTALALTAPATPVPAQTWVQARMTLAADAPARTTGEVQVRLTVDASGADQPAPPLAPTGSAPLGAGLLALAAVGGGLAVVALARRRRRG